MSEPGSLASAPRAPGPPRRIFSWKILPAFAVSGLVLWIVVRHLAGTNALAAALARARWHLLPVAYGCLLVNLALGLLRWRVILGALGHDVPVGRLLYAVLATWPLAVLTPSRASDVLRAFCIKDRVPVYAGAGSVLVEKLVDVQSLCLLSLGGTLAFGQWRFAGLAGGLLLAEWAVVVLLFVRREAFLGLPGVRKVATKLSLALAPMDALKRAPASFLALSLTSLGSWLCAVGIIAALLVTFGAEVPLPVSLALWPLATFAGLLPLTVAGMGTRDGAFLYLLTHVVPAGLDRGAVAAATLGFSLISTWTLVIAGIPFMAHFLMRLFASGPASEA